MTASKDLAGELQQLLAAMALQSSRHLSEVQTDLHQTATLLAEAIETLGDSFIRMHASMVAQHALIAGLQDGATLPPQLAEKLAQLQADGSAQVNAGVTALQFHDMTGQLLGRIASHVASLRDVLESVGATGQALVGHDSDARVLAVLGAANRILEEKNTLVDSVAPKAVAQTHLRSGDIEMF